MRQARIIVLFMFGLLVVLGSYTNRWLAESNLRIAELSGDRCVLRNVDIVLHDHAVVSGIEAHDSFMDVRGNSTAVVNCIFYVPSSTTTAIKFKETR